MGQSRPPETPGFGSTTALDVTELKIDTEAGMTPLCLAGESRHFRLGASAVAR